MEEFEISKIIVGPRKRPLDKDFVEQLAESIRQEGLLQPIIITPNGKLIAGNHRLEAFKSLGKTNIPIIIKDVDDQQAEIIEIIENIEREEVSVLQKAEMLGRLKEIYEEKYPETKQGGDRKTNCQNGEMKAPRFTQQISGTSSKERTRQRLLQIGKIDPGVRAQLHGTWISDHQNILEEILGFPLSSQRQFVEKFKAGKTKTPQERESKPGPF